MSIDKESIQAHIAERTGRTIDSAMAQLIAGHASYVTDGLNGVDLRLLDGVEPSMAFQPVRPEKGGA